jgi:hypothetical protein
MYSKLAGFYSRYEELACSAATPNVSPVRWRLWSSRWHSPAVEDGEFSVHGQKRSPTQYSTTDGGRRLLPREQVRCDAKEAELP